MPTCAHQLLSRCWNLGFLQMLQQLNIPSLVESTTGSYSTAPKKRKHSEPKKEPSETPVRRRSLRTRGWFCDAGSTIRALLCSRSCARRLNTGSIYPPWFGETLMVLQTQLPEVQRLIDQVYSEPVARYVKNVGFHFCSRTWLVFPQSAALWNAQV